MPLLLPFIAQAAPTTIVLPMLPRKTYACLTKLTKLLVSKRLKGQAKFSVCVAKDLLRSTLAHARVSWLDPLGAALTEPHGGP